MIIVDLPVLENVMNLNSDIKLSGYHLYSSIYETTPKLSFSYTPGYTTPDMLGLAFGSSFPIRWKTELSFEEATEDDLNNSVLFLSNCLYKYYGKKVIILVDEYDVPIQEGYLDGFYKCVGYLLIGRALYENPNT